MRQARYYFAAILLASVISAIPGVILAHEPGDGAAPATGSPDGSGTGFDGRDAFAGPTWQIDKCAPGDGTAKATGSAIIAAGTPPPTVECPLHWSLDTHRHVWVRTTSNYYGYYYYNSQRSCVGPCTISYTETRSLSNAWGASIGFDKKPISGALSFNVSWTESYSWAVVLNNPQTGVNRQARFKDGFYVSVGDVRTDHCSDLFCWGPIIYREYGTGWGARFDNRTYYLQAI